MLYTQVVAGVLIHSMTGLQLWGWKTLVQSDSEWKGDVQTVLYMNLVQPTVQT